MKQPNNPAPCLDCGKPTKARHGMCQPCLDRTDVTRGDHVCPECRVALTSNELCMGCFLAIRDDEGVRGIGESHYDLDAHGFWRLDPVRRVQVFVPAPEADDPWDDSPAAARGRLAVLVEDTKTAGSGVAA